MKTYKTKKSVFDNLEDALNYSNEVCKKHVMTQAKKITSKIISQNKEELHHLIYYINGETEYFIKMLQNNTYVPIKMNRKDYQKNVVYAWEERAFKKVGFFNSDFRNNFSFTQTCIAAMKDLNPLGAEPKYVSKSLSNVSRGFS